ncbi:MAG: SDR family oxidoreductase [Bacteriovoracaceae bacterium]|nr:SDR family oxidoreductase [Bacteriovoracaceae bacterium]
MCDQFLLDKEMSSKPLVNCGKVLVTGASGYIGGRIIPTLTGRGYDVRIMVRRKIPEYEDMWPNVEIAEASTLQFDKLLKALEGVDTAYYLIHSLLMSSNQFFQAEIQSATNFRIAAQKQGVKRIIYLGGLGDESNDLSDHLQSRIQVAKELRKGKVPVTVLKAAIIIGSGSASYELIKDVIEKIPVIVCSKHYQTKCQPIAERDVRKYLIGVLENPDTVNKDFDIGGPDILTYKEMLVKLAEILGKKRVFLKSPIHSSKVISYISSLISSVPAPLIFNLMDGLKNDVVCKHDDIKNYVRINRHRYKDAILHAIDSEAEDNVITRWSNAYYPHGHEHYTLETLPAKPHYSASYSIFSNKTAEQLFHSICQVGGKHGWFHNNWMWRIRGMIDRVLMGVGTSRGRRDYTSLRTNDVVDFWRVEKIKQNQELTLFAEMKMPGLAWLKFAIASHENKHKLSVTAYFQSNGFLGFLYWTFFLPFHYLIFNGLLVQLDKRS